MESESQKLYEGEMQREEARESIKDDMAGRSAEEIIANIKGKDKASK